MQNIQSIKRKFFNPITGINWEFEYFDCNDFSVLNKKEIIQCRAICYMKEENRKIKNEICIVQNKQKRTWGLPGGSIEEGETFEETLKRELIEEANIELLISKPLGYQIALNTNTNEKVTQLRYFVLAKKIGEFVADPADGIGKVEFINPKNYKNYEPWSDSGDEVFKKAEGIYNDLLNK
jgi:8-oxo-dGTP pyrophosphatase MutT (NUDIX family)